MKRIQIFLAVLCSAACLHAQPTTADWQQTAEGMSRALIREFWGANFEGYPQRYYFNYYTQLRDLSTIHYWPQAHAMDVIVDALLRTGHKDYRALFPLWWEGAPKHNPNSRTNPADPWWNVFVDDMEWIALAQIRMSEATGNRTYAEKARQIYDQWIWTQWGPTDEAPWHGGITWKTDVDKSKNACSNGPAALIAARLCRFYDKFKFRSGKPRMAYLDEASRIYAWERRHLFDPQTGAVYDNMDRQGHIQRNWIFTYNQGTFLGAAHELFLLTGNQEYLADAARAGRYVVEKMEKNGALSDAPSGDGGLFHGILFRYLVKLANEPALPIADRRIFHSALTRWATTLRTQGLNPRTMLYGGRWQQSPADSEPVCLTAHLTGCMLMEAMCVLQPLSE